LTWKNDFNVAVTCLLNFFIKLIQLNRAAATSFWHFRRFWLANLNRLYLRNCLYNWKCLLN